MCVPQVFLLVWLYIAVHGFAAPPSASASGPSSWQEAAGRLAADGTPAAILSGSADLLTAEVSSGESPYSPSVANVQSSCWHLPRIRENVHCPKEGTSTTLLDVMVLRTNCTRRIGNSPEQIGKQGDTSSSGFKAAAADQSRPQCGSPCRRPTSYCSAACHSQRKHG